MEELLNYCHEDFQQEGANPQLGVIFGFLMTKDGPVSLGEIAEGIRLSKASVSLLIRQLNRMGYCRKVPRPGDRKDYYEVNEHHMRAVLSRKIRLKRFQIEELKRINEKNGPALPPKVLLRLEKLHRFESLSCESLEALLEEWESAEG